MKPKKYKRTGKIAGVSFLLIIISSIPAWASSDCDKAHSIFWKGRYAPSDSQAYRYYERAIALCPGFIRPYELMGNIHRKNERPLEAVEFFNKAAELGTTNYKLYYLLAKLYYEQGDLDAAGRQIKKSLSIREDYPKAIKLNLEIERRKDSTGPKIILFEPAIPRGLKIVHRFGNLSVRGLATDKSGVAWVKVNELTASLDERGNFLKDLPIRIGANSITIESADGLGNTSQLSINVDGEEYAMPNLEMIDATSQLKTLYNRSVAVVIGINQYEKWPALEFAVADAKAVKASLVSGGFDEVVMVMDKEATHRRILTELFDRLPQLAEHNDRVLFYFAGHGHTQELQNGGKRGYIIPVDADPANNAKTSISMEQIRSLSSRIRAKHILFIMDSCYSGLGLNRSGGIAQTENAYLRKVSSMRVVQIITAGGQGEQVQESEGHGLFTSYFLKAIAGEADFNQDKVVTGTELGAYLRPTVSNASRQAQTPLFGRLEGEGEFLFFAEPVR